MTRDGAATADEPGDTVGVVVLFDDVNGCKKFAQRVLSAVARNRAIIIVPWWWKVFWWVNRLSPALGEYLLHKALAVAKKTLVKAP